MGCGASVHVSESESCLVEQGAHCDETEIASAKGGESASLSGVVGHLEQLEETLKEALKSKRLSMEAETQTQHWRQVSAILCGSFLVANLRTTIECVCCTLGRDSVN